MNIYVKAMLKEKIILSRRYTDSGDPNLLCKKYLNITEKYIVYENLNSMGEVLIYVGVEGFTQAAEWNKPIDLSDFPKVILPKEGHNK